MARAKKATKKTAKKTSSSRQQKRKQPRKAQKKNIEKRLETVAKRQEKQKEKLLEELERMPIIEAMLRKVGISKSTYYRWQEDPEFNDKCNEALAKGQAYYNDVAESKVIKGVNNGDANMVKFWLRHNCKRYGAKHTYEIYIRDELELQQLIDLEERVHEWKKEYPKVKAPQDISEGE